MPTRRGKALLRFLHGYLGAFGAWVVPLRADEGQPAIMVSTAAVNAARASVELTRRESNDMTTVLFGCESSNCRDCKQLPLASSFNWKKIMGYLSLMVTPL